MEFPNIDPIAIDLGFFQIRWYALAYLGGFLGGWFTADRLVRLYPEGSRPNRNDVENLVTWVVLGVVLGGRLGYVLFYNLGYFLQNPGEILQMWQGGMSFHGGMIGVMIAIVGYALFQKISLLRVGDVVAAVVPIGLGLGRLSNFINGELYGRVTDVPWAMIFPHSDGLPRHPSQLYEAGLEGILLGLAMYLCWRRGWLKATGRLTGLFLFGYGLARFLVELVRQPDAHIGLLAGGLSMGQILSLPMMLLGLYLLRHALRPSHDQEGNHG